jgi:DNA-binding IclR family transcriptional regulator
MEKSKLGEKLSSQERIFEITRLLYENHVTGLTNKELAGAVGTSEANLCRDMALFDRHGWATRNNTGRWRLSPIFGGIAGRIMRSYQEAKLRLTEEEAKYASAMQ